MLNSLFIPLKNESKKINKNERKKKVFKCCHLEGIFNVKIMDFFFFKALS